MAGPEPQLAIFVSPHFDDIPLSCGGMAARLSQAGANCVCLVLFAAPAPPDKPLSPFAQMLHEQWQSDAPPGQKAINEVRRDEEREAMRLLGLRYEWLDLPDAPYRTAASGEHIYTSAGLLFDGKPVPEERRTLVPRIAGEIRRVARQNGARGRVRVFAPLGVGHHVDHQLAFLAARRLGPRYGVLHYEDYPYAGREGALEARIAELNLPVQPRLTTISDLLGVKIAAIARYKSQLPILFGSAEAMPAAVRSYGESIAGSAVEAGYAERYWFLPATYVLG